MQDNPTIPTSGARLRLTRIAVGLSLALAATSVACKRDAAAETPCRAVVDHTIGLLSGDAAEKATADRMQLIKKCGTTNDAQRTCALAAQTVPDLGTCGAPAGAAAPAKASASKRPKKRAKKARSKTKKRAKTTR